MQLTSWLVWAGILFAQNISFTYVSRARSSGSLFRHLKASIFSNVIWIFSQIIMLGVMFDNLTGKHGLAMQLSSAAVYTVACVTGSIFAHWLAMKTEKGKNAVGYNKKYAQIPVEDWEQFQKNVITVTKISAETLKVVNTLPTKEEFEHTKALALQAYDITVGIIPDSGIKAHNFDGVAVITGLDQQKG